MFFEILLIHTGLESRRRISYRSGFYETAGNVKVFVVVFAFVFSLVAFLFLLLRLRLSFVRVLKNHLGLLYALAGSR